MSEPPENEVERAIRGRRSVRAWRSQPVERALIERLITVACCAPSAGNGQPWKFLVVEDRALLAVIERAVRDATAAFAAGIHRDDRPAFAEYARHFTHFAAAPTVIVPTYRPGRWALDRGEADALISVSAAAQNLLLYAHSRGLGTCLMTGPLVAEPAIKDCLAIPPSWRVHSLIPLGYPAETPAATPRRPAEFVIRFVGGPCDPTSPKP